MFIYSLSMDIWVFPRFGCYVMMPLRTAQLRLCVDVCFHGSWVYAQEWGC